MIVIAEAIWQQTPLTPRHAEADFRRHGVGYTSRSAAMKARF
ncbi:hypothetical protein [Roseovarius indicus]|nr:hypothetical protein [Roseovarius indicus]